MGHHWLAYAVAYQHNQADAYQRKLFYHLMLQSKEPTDEVSRDNGKVARERKRGTIFIILMKFGLDYTGLKT